jgi:leucyl-tRNA synthetase
MTWSSRPAAVLRHFLILLQPFSPHVAEELWFKLNATMGTAHTALAYAPWPNFEPQWLVETTVEIPVQVNGKLRDVIVVSIDAPASELESAAMNSDKVKPFIAGKTILKVVVLPKKLVNIVVR